MSPDGKIIRIVILVNKMTWELQRHVDVIIPIKSDHLFKKRTFLSPSPICAALISSRIVALEYCYSVQSRRVEDVLGRKDRCVRLCVQVSADSSLLQRVLYVLGVSSWYTEVT